MIVRLILSSFGRIMGCLFGCFRFRDESPCPQPHLVSSTNHKRDPFVSRNPLASLLLTQDNGGSPSKETKYPCLESPPPNSNVMELKDEAKFLKSWGVLLETPVEIRKASARVEELLHHNEDVETSKFHSWLPNTSIEQLQWQEHLNKVAISLGSHSEDMREEFGSPGHGPSRGKKVTGDISSYPESNVAQSCDTVVKVPVCRIDSEMSLSVSSGPPTVTAQCKNKCVRFECESDRTPPSHNSQDSKQSDSSGSHNGSKHSPYPTPLKLTDEMQTPGTVYPANADSLANGKNARIRSQYVYHVLNPVQNLSQLIVRKEEDYCNYKQLDQLRESLEQKEYASPDCTSVLDTSNLAMERQSSPGKKVSVDASLCHWVKPHSSLNDDKGQILGCISSGGSPSKTPQTERPILGTVAAHWNDDDPSRISPKWWDGNGIPNSTNKYKEDQKVSWHATPFEERLEKALTNETLVYQRRLSSGPVDFAEKEEADTAVSRFQSSKHAESVVSF